MARTPEEEELDKFIEEMNKVQSTESVAEELKSKSPEQLVADYEAKVQDFISKAPETPGIGAYALQDIKDIAKGAAEIAIAPAVTTLKGELPLLPKAGFQSVGRALKALFPEQANLPFEEEVPDYTDIAKAAGEATVEGIKYVAKDPLKAAYENPIDTLLLAAEAPLVISKGVAAASKLAPKLPDVTAAARKALIPDLPDVTLTRTSAGETATIPVTNEGMRAANVDVERLTRTRQKPMKDIFDFEEQVAPAIKPPELTEYEKLVRGPITELQQKLPELGKSILERRKKEGTHKNISVVDGKVVYDDGTPVRVLRGSRDPDIFKTKAGVKGVNRVEDSYFFTDNEPLARTYAGTEGKGYLFEADVEMQNPLIVEGNGALWDKIPFGKTKASTNAIVKYAKEQGYDGVIFKDIQDVGPKAGTALDPEISLSNVIVSLKKDNIKSHQVVTDKPRSLSAGADISSPREEIDGSGQLLLFPRSQMRSVAPVPPQLQAFAEAGIPPDWKPTREFLESNLKLLEGRLNRVRNKASKAEIAELKQNIQLTKDEIAALKPAEQLELPFKAPKLSPMRMRTKTPMVTVEDLNALQRQGIELRKNIATVVEAINKNPDNELLNLQLDELNKQYKALVEQAGTKAEQYNKPSNVAFDDKHRALIDRVEKLKSDVAAQETLIADAKAAGKKAPSGSVKKLGMLERELEVQQNKLDNYKPKLPGYVVKGPVSEMRKKAEGTSPGGGLPFQFTQDTPYKRGIAEREQQSKLVDAIDYELGILEQAGKINTKEYRKLERESIDADNKLYKLMLEYRDPGEFVKDYDLYNKEYNRVLNNVPHGVPGTDIYELRVQSRAVDLHNAFNNRQDVVNEFLEIAKKHPDIFEFLPPQHPLNELRSKIQTTGIVDRLRNLLGKKKGGGGTGGEGGSGGLPPGGTPPQLPPAGGSQLQKAFGQAVTAPKERTPFSNAGNSPEQLFKQLEKYFKPGEAPKPRAEGGEEYEASVIKYERGGSPPPIGLDEKIKEMDLPRVYPKLESEIIQLENGIIAAKEELRQVTAVFKSTTDPEIKNAVAINKKKLEEFVNNLNTQLAERKIQHIYMQRPDWLEEITLDSYGKAVKSPKVFIDWEPRYNTLKIKDMTDGQNGELYHVIGSVRPNGSMDMSIYTVDWSIDPDKLTGKRPRSRMFTGKELMQYFMYFHRNTIKSISDLYVEGNNQMFNEAYNRAYPGLRKQFPKSIAQQLALREAAAGTFSGQQHLSRGFDIKEVTADLERGGKIYGPSVQYDIRPRGGSGGKK
jgi:hypothetical protein